MIKNIKNMLLSISVAGFLAGCGNQASIPSENTLASNDAVPGETLQTQAVGSCTKEVSYPHQSETNRLEVIAKGRIICTPNPDPIIAIATVYLYNGAGALLDSKTKTLPTSKTATVRLEFGTPGFVAVAPCVSGNYYGAIRVRYENLSGGVISVGLPANTPIQTVTCK